MFIKAGATRIVLLVPFMPKYPIKIARFPVTVVVKSLVVSLNRKLRSRTPMQLTAKRAGTHLATMRQQFLGNGIRANRAEADYWNRTEDRDCIPVVAVWLGGFIIVQRRGDKVTKSEVLMSDQGWRMYVDPEFAKPKQFARFGDRIVLVDYASLGDPTLGAVAPDQLV